MITIFKTQFMWERLKEAIKGQLATSALEGEKYHRKLLQETLKSTNPSLS